MSRDDVEALAVAVGVLAPTSRPLFRKTLATGSGVAGGVVMGICLAMIGIVIAYGFIGPWEPYCLTIQ